MLFTRRCRKSTIIPMLIENYTPLLKGFIQVSVNGTWKLANAAIFIKHASNDCSVVYPNSD